MLACIACSKHANGSVESSMDEDGIQKSPATRETIRSLTNQLKEMAVRFSAGAYRHCKPCAAQGFNEEGHCIDSMDITDASSELSMSSTQNMGSNYYSTPLQSFKGTPRRKKTNHAYSVHKYNHNSNSKNHGININGYKGNDIPNNNGNRKVQGSLENGSKSEYEEDELEKEWVAQVEPGILITFVTLHDGGNELKRIRFSREMFNKWQAQQWWADNCDKVHELYNVPKFNGLPESLPTPSRSEDENYKWQSSKKQNHRSRKPGAAYHHDHHHRVRALSTCGGDHLGGHEDSLASCPSEWDTASEATHHHSAKEEDAHNLNNYNSGSEAVSAASDQEDPLSSNEWVQEDEPGVYITLSSSSSRGFRELKRIRFSREKYTEVQARLWWEENRVRIYEQYIR